jgi:colanic acid/amylovoran biosynthesis glycosyltransferase
MNTSGPATRVAYLVNQYPKTSHAWIRREIHALADHGVEVVRFSVRRVSEPLVDAADRAEAERTHVLLDEGAAALAFAVLATLFGRPLAFARALALTLRLGWRSTRGLGLHLVYLAEACLLRRRLAERDLRHVHAHFGTNSAKVAMFCRELGGPSFSFTFHGPEVFEFPALDALREQVHRAAFSVAISHHGRSQLCRWSEVEHWPRIHLVGCGLDAGFLEAEPVPLPSEPRLVCVARLDPVKGHLVLLEALARLARRGRKPTVALVGDGALRGAIEGRARALGLAERVSFLGWLDGAGVRREIEAARAMVLPSFDEGLPVVFMEAYALGRPVLSTYIAGIPELVVPGRTGWLVPAGSVDHLEVALDELLDTPDERMEAFGAAGRREVEALHDVRTEAGRLAGHFRSALTTGESGA